MELLLDFSASIKKAILLFIWDDQHPYKEGVIVDEISDNIFRNMNCKALMD